MAPCWPCLVGIAIGLYVFTSLDSAHWRGASAF
jgi:hypothetical protein